MRLRLARKLEMRMLWAAATAGHDGSRAFVRGWVNLTRAEKRERLASMLTKARVRRQTWRRAFQRVWKAETK